MSVSDDDRDAIFRMQIERCRERAAPRVEIRAAEIAAWKHHGFTARWRGCEKCGWLAHERDLPLDHDLPITHRHTMEQYDAGYLARQIVTHEEERPMTLDEVKDALQAGAEVRAAAERTLKRAPRR